MARKTTLKDVEQVQGHALAAVREPPTVMLRFSHLKNAALKSGKAPTETDFMLSPEYAEQIARDLLLAAQSAKLDPLH